MNKKIYIINITQINKILKLIYIFYYFHTYIYIYNKNILNLFPSKSSTILSTILLQILIHKYIIQISHPLNITNFYQLNLITN